MAEDARVEYKRSLSEWKEGAETLAAFATAQGGRVVFGVGPDGKRVGVTLGRNTLENLAADIKRHTDPPLFPAIGIEGDESDAVVTVSIEESPVKPVFAFGRAYKRVGRANLVLSREEVLRLSDATRGSTWDALLCPGLKPEHLSRAAVEDFLRRAGQALNLATEAVLDNLSLRAGDTLLNGAALLFATDPQRWIVGSEVKCARFDGVSSTRFLDQQTLYSTLLAMIDEALAFVRRNTRQSIRITGRPERETVPEYPEEAVREAIVNAVCHRDYTEAGTVQVRIYDDRLEVWNPGYLPYDLTLDALYRPHHSHPRNKRLAEAFHRANLIERWGTGTLRIVEAYTSQGLPAPQFLQEIGQFIVRLLPTPPPFKTPSTLPPLDLSGLNERQRKAVEYVQQHGSITRAEYVNVAGVSERQASRDLAALVGADILTRRGRTTSAQYTLLTQQGRVS